MQELRLSEGCSHRGDGRARSALAMPERIGRELSGHDRDCRRASLPSRRSPPVGRRWVHPTAGFGEALSASPAEALEQAGRLIEKSLEEKTEYEKNIEKTIKER